MRSLRKRLEILEGPKGTLRHAAILMQPGRSQAEALSEWEAVNGPSEGEPVFIRLVGVRPGVRRTATVN